VIIECEDFMQIKAGNVPFRVLTCVDLNINYRFCP
jgi:hypothetical protein